MNELLDSDTLTAFCQRDPNAFKKVFDLFYHQLRFFTEKVIGDAEEARDITADTFVKLYKKCERFNTATNIRAFLFITARNNCFDYLRHQKRVKSHNKSLYYELLSDSVENLCIEKKELQAIVTAKVYEAIEQLPTECKKVFKMLYYEGIDQAKVASRLGVTISTVRNHKSRALQLLRLSLADHEFAALILLPLSYLPLA